MKNNLTILGLAFLFLTNISCRRTTDDNVEEDSVYKSYEVDYNQQTNDFSVKSVFRIKNSWGTKIKLTENSKSSYGGVDLQWNSVLARYDYKQNTPILDGSFFWRDKSNNTAEVYAPIYTAELKTGSTEISQIRDTKLYWDGEPLRENEKITVTITDKLGGIKTFTASNQSRTYINIIRTEINDLEPGDATIYFERLYNNTFTDFSEGGNITIKFKSIIEDIYLR